MNNQDQETEVTSLEELLDRIVNSCAEQGRTSLDAILDSVGRRSFGPLLLLSGLITLAPLIGDIPGMPTVMGLVVLFTSVQLLLKRDHFWMPQWMLKRTVPEEKLKKGTEWLRKPARFLDRWTHPRFTRLIHGPGTYVIAIVCTLIALSMPAMELIPFSANGAGAALTAFGLALIARDGLLALVAIIITAGTVGGILVGLL